MLFASLMKRVPYIGNIVPAKYLVVSGIGKHMDRIMPCWSVRIITGNNLDIGLILSQSDLTEAHFRYVKYFDALTDREKSIPLGTYYTRSFETKRRGGKPVDLVLFFFSSEGGERTGYLFAQNDMIRIIQKTQKIKATVKRPTFWQCVLIRINKIFGNLD